MTPATLPPVQQMMLPRSALIALMPLGTLTDTAKTPSHGTMTPDIRRVYETDRRDGDLCIWEHF
jgi:hypothetical protein